MSTHDRCVPETEAESRKLWALLGDERCGSKTATPSDHIIRLSRYAAQATPATADRWRSFGCVVLDERSPDESRLTDEEIIKLAAQKVRL